MEFVDTHCHIHFPDYKLDPDEVREAATENGVTRLICVGCTLQDSKLGIEMAQKHDNVWASIGLHPHEAKDIVNDEKALQEFQALAKEPKVVAIGETGLDFYYNHSPRDVQEALLQFQIEIALEHDLPLIFHVRDAFDEFWPIFDKYEGIRGVIHSFSATTKEIEQILTRPNLYVGLNGIMTFTKQHNQLEAARRIPLERLVLETDAPFLTPVPYRGKVCEPRYVRNIASFLAELRYESLDDLAKATTANAKQLFQLGA
jgi:TatD DNase family protein